jgi:hypothetical protein
MRRIDPVRKSSIVALTAAVVVAVGSWLAAGPRREHGAVRSFASETKPAAADRELEVVDRDTGLPVAAASVRWSSYVGEEWTTRSLTTDARGRCRLPRFKTQGDAQVVKDRLQGEAFFNGPAPGAVLRVELRPNVRCAFSMPTDGGRRGRRSSS